MYDRGPGSCISFPTFRVPGIALPVPSLRWVLGLESWVPPLGNWDFDPRSYLWDGSCVSDLGSNLKSRVLGSTAIHTHPDYNHSNVFRRHSSCFTVKFEAFHTFFYSPHCSIWTGYQHVILIWLWRCSHVSKTSNLSSFNYLSNMQNVKPCNICCNI